MRLDSEDQGPELDNINMKIQECTLTGGMQLTLLMGPLVELYISSVMLISRVKFENPGRSIYIGVEMTRPIIQAEIIIIKAFLLLLLVTYSRG